MLAAMTAAPLRGFLVVIARSELRKVLFLAPSVGFCLCMKYLVGEAGGTAEWICAKFTWKTCLVPHLNEFEGHGHQGQKGLFGPFSGLRVVSLVKHL